MTEQKTEDPIVALLAEDENGFTFANKTSQWIAYERHVESMRSDRLFNDPLAVHLCGKYGKTLSDSFAKHAPMLFPGLGECGFLWYHASRTKLLSEEITKWSLGFSAEVPHQVINLGSGHDTRAFWDSALNSVSLYIEVDEAQVNEPKERIIENIQPTPKLVCKQRVVVSLDFSKESILDLPKKAGFDATIPSCWLLEGLVMYLEEAAVQNLYSNIITLSAKGSVVIVNIVGHSKTHHKAEFADIAFLENGWTKISNLKFGEPGFTWRYPKEVEPNKSLGFVFYQKK